MPAALEATVTTAPRPRSTIRPTTAREVKNTPSVFTPNVSAQSSSDSERASPVRSTPAALTRYSIGPSRASTSATAASTSTPDRTSAGNDSARMFSLASSLATSRSPSTLRSTSATVAPSAPSRAAITEPMPPAAPVTRATRPDISG